MPTKDKYFSTSFADEGQRSKLPEFSPSLSPTTLLLMSTNRDVAVVRRFFYRLTHNLPPDQIDAVTPQGLLLADRGVRAEVERYLEHFEATGRRTKAIQYLRGRYAQIDPHDFDSIVDLSVWNSFFVYPWEDGYQANKLTGYIKTFMRSFARDMLTRSHSSLDALPSAETSPHELRGTVFMGRPPRDPEEIVLEKMSFDEREAELLGSKTKSMYQKRRVLRLLSEGEDPRAISENLGVEYPLIMKWIRRMKSLPYSDRNRVTSSPGGHWIWDANTAYVILNDPHALKLLSEKEMEILRHLTIGESLEDIFSKYPNLANAQRNIKHKLKSHGTMDGPTSNTFTTQRRQLLIFLDSIMPQDDDEAHIIRTIKETNGNVAKAAESLGVTRNKLVYFLKDNGYYLK